LAEWPEGIAKEISLVVDLKAEPGEWRRLKGGRFFSG